MVWTVTAFGTAAADRDAGEALSAGAQMSLALGVKAGCLALAAPAADSAGDGTVDSLRALLAAYGVTRGVLAKSGSDLDGEALAEWLGREMSARDAAVWVFPGTPEWRAAAAMLAVRLGWPIASEVLELDGARHGDAPPSAGSSVTLGVVRPIFGGSLLAVETLTAPCIIVLRPRAFAGGPQEGAAVDQSRVEIEDSSAVPSTPAGGGRVKVVALQERQSDMPAIGDAEVIVSGGRGLGEGGGFELLEKLARALGGCLGASRAAVDAGWVPYEAQVGQSGRTVAPRLYVAVGISGAAQHLAGMRGSRVVVAINRNPEAQIFGACNFGLQGDWREIVSALLDELGKGGPAARN